MSFLPLFAEEIGLTTAGLFFTAMALTAFISRPFAGLIMDRTGGAKGSNFNVILAVTAMIIAVIIVSGNVITAPAGGRSYFGVGGGFIQSTLMVAVVDSAPASGKGRAIATYWALLIPGVSAGSLFWGLIADACGYRLMYVLAIIPLLAALVVFFAWRSAMRQPATGGDTCMVKISS